MDGDWDRAAALLSACFPRRVDPAELRWKLGGNGETPVLSVAAFENDRMVGLCGNIAMPFLIEGREMTAALGVDLALLPSHRKLPLFLGLMNRAVQGFKEHGVAMAYGFPNEDAAELNRNALGFRDLAPQPAMVRILRPLRYVLLRAGWSRREPPFSPTFSALPPSRKACRLTPVTRFDRRFDTFYERIRNDTPIQSVRSAAQLNRRYTSAPHAPYAIWALETADPNAIAGYAVVRPIARPRGERRARILDLITAKQDGPETADLLIRSLMQQLKRTGFDTADLWMFPHTHLHAALRRAGFHPRAKENRPAQIRWLDPAIPPTLFNQPHAWRLSLGDSDYA